MSFDKLVWAKTCLGYAGWLQNMLRIHRNMFSEHLTLPNIGSSISDSQISTLGTTIDPPNLFFVQESPRRPFGSPNTLRLVVAKPPVGSSRFFFFFEGGRCVGWVGCMCACRILYVCTLYALSRRSRENGAGSCAGDQKKGRHPPLPTATTLSALACYA